MNKKYLNYLIKMINLGAKNGPVGWNELKITYCLDRPVLPDGRVGRGGPRACPQRLGGTKLVDKINLWHRVVSVEKLHYCILLKHRVQTASRHSICREVVLVHIVETPCSSVEKLH